MYFFSQAASVSSSGSYSSQQGQNFVRTDGYVEIATDRSDLSAQDLKVHTSFHTVS